MKHKNDFEFKYVAPTIEERKEIESIKRTYIAQSTGSNKLGELRKLDNKVKNTPTLVSLIVGIVGILIFGLGMSMVLEWKLLLWGIVVSIIGIVPMSLAYPINKFVFKRLKNKYSAKIIKLSEELLNDENKNI